MRVIFTPLAERHIDSLHEYLAAHASEGRADGYVIEGIFYGGRDFEAAFHERK